MKKIKELMVKYRELIIYLIVGVLTTIVSWLAYGLSKFFLDVEHSAFQMQVAVIIRWVAGVLFAYVTNRKYVFESDNCNKLKEISNFFIARLLTLILDMIIMYLGVNILLLNDKFIKIVSQILIIVSNYILSKLFVFKKS